MIWVVPCGAVFSPGNDTGSAGVMASAEISMSPGAGVGAAVRYYMQSEVPALTAR